MAEVEDDDTDNGRGQRSDEEPTDEDKHASKRQTTTGQRHGGAPRFNNARSEVATDKT